MGKDNGNGTKGSLVKTTTSKGTFYFVLGEDIRQFDENTLHCPLVYLFQPPSNWHLHHDFQFDPHTVETVNQGDRALILPACFSCPVEISDPILMAMMNERRLNDFTKTLFGMQQSVKTLGDALSLDDANTLVQQLIAYEAGLFGNSTWVQQLYELYFVIHTRTALQHILELAEQGIGVENGIAVATIVQDAKLQVLLTRNDPE